MKTVQQQIDAHYDRLLQRHGLCGSDAQRARDYMTRGYSNVAAIKLTQARGDHRVLLQEAR